MHKINTDMEQENKPLARLNFKKLTWIAATLVALITLIAYLPALQNGFVNWDDNGYVYENQNIQSIDLSFLKWVLTAKVVALWHPLTMFSLALDYAIWGLNPLGYHLTNILFHTANTFLAFILVVRLIECKTITNTTPPSPLFNKEWARGRYPLIAASVTALLFGIHPLHVESVAWVSERKDVLCAFFFLLSLLAYLRYASFDDFKRPLFYAASLISFALALLSKPMAVSLPLVLLIFDFYPLRRLKTGFMGMLAEKLPFFALSFLSSLVTVWAHHSQKALPVETFHSVEPVLFMAHVMSRAYMFYMGKMLLPFNLSPLYPRPTTINPSFTGAYIEYLVSFILFLALAYFAIRFLKRNKLFSSVWLYYTVTLIPVIGFVPVGSHAAADRYTYLPSLGPFLLLGLGAEYLFERHSKRIYRIPIATALIFILILLANKTMAQTALWKDSVTLWTRVISFFPDSDVAYVNRGNAYGSLGEDQEAIKDLDRAIRLNPGSINGYRNRGSAYRRLGNYQQSIKDYTKAIELDPLETSKASTYGNRGISYRSLGDYQAALKDFDSALKSNPRDSMAYYERGITYMTISEYRLSIKDFSEAIRFNPGFAEVFCLRGATYVRSGSYTQAIEDFGMAVKLKPGFEEAYYNRGTTYRIIGDNYKAINDFNVAIKLNPRNAEAYNNRGNAQRDLGNYQQAVEDYSMAIKLNPKDAIAYKNRGITYQNMGNTELASENFNRADELSLDIK